MGNEASSIRDGNANAWDGEAAPRLVLHLDAIVASAVDQALLHPEAEAASPPWHRALSSDAGTPKQASLEMQLPKSEPVVLDCMNGVSVQRDPMDAETWKLRPRGDGAGLFATVLLDGERVKTGHVESFPSALIELKPRHWTSQVQINFFLSPASNDYEPSSYAARDQKVWSVLSATIATLVSFGAPLYASLWVGLNSIEDQVDKPNILLEDAVKRAQDPDPNIPKVKITLYKPASHVKIPASRSSVPGSHPENLKMPSSQGSLQSARLENLEWMLPATAPDLGLALSSRHSHRGLGPRLRRRIISDAGSTVQQPEMPTPHVTSVLRTENNTFRMFAEDNHCLESKPLSYEALRGLIRCLRESNEIADGLQQQLTGDPDRMIGVEEEPQVIRKIANEIEVFQKMFVSTQKKWASEKMQLLAEADRLRGQMDSAIDHHDAVLAGLSAGHSEDMKATCEEIRLAERSLQSCLASVDKEYNTEMQLAHSGADVQAASIQAEVDGHRFKWKEEQQQELERHTGDWERAHQQAWDIKEQVLRDECDRRDYQAAALRHKIETHKQNIEDVLSKRDELTRKLQSQSSEIERDAEESRTEQDSQLVISNVTSQSNLQLLKTREEYAALAREEELNLLRSKLDESRRHRQEMLGQVGEQFHWTLQNTAAVHAARTRDQSIVDEHQLTGVLDEHKRHMDSKHRHLHLKDQAHEVQVSNLNAAIEHEEKHAAQLADQICALRAELEPLGRQIADLEQHHRARADEHETLVDGMINQISFNQQEAGQLSGQSEQAVADITKSHAEQLSTTSLENNRALSHWEAHHQQLGLDLAIQQQRAEQRCTEMKSLWEQKHANANEALQGARGRLEQSEARAAQALEERSRELNRRLESVEARQLAEVRALQLQLAGLTEPGQQETIRLQREIEVAEQEASSVLERISAEVEKQLEQHSYFHRVSQHSLAGEHAEQVQQMKQVKEAALAQLHTAHGAWVTPLETELEHLRMSRLELQEAKQQERALMQELAGESTILEVQMKANNEISERAIGKRNALATCETELAQAVLDLERVEPQIAEIRTEFKQLEEDHTSMVSSTLSKKEATISAIHQDLDDLRKQIEQQRADAEALHDSQLQDLEVKLSAEKHDLSSRVVVLGNELREARSAADRARKALMGDLRTDLDTVNAETNKVLAELQDEQKMLVALREQAKEEARQRPRAVNEASTKIMADMEDEISKRRQASQIERQSHLDRHEAQVRQLQTAHDQERLQSEVSFGEQQRLIASMRAKVSRREKECDDVSSEVARLRKDLTAVELQRERGLRDTSESQSTDLSHTRELLEDRHALIRREAKAQQQHLMQQLHIAAADAARFTTDFEALQGAREKKRLANSQEAELKQGEIALLKRRLDDLVQTDQIEREELRQQLEHAEHQALHQSRKTGGGKMAAEHDQTRLERELESLRDRLKEAKERLKHVQQEVESQEQQLLEKLSLELEHQERGFAAQLQSNNTAHRADASVREWELKQAADLRQTENHQERHRTLAEIAEMEASIPKMQSSLQRGHSLRQEVSVLIEHHNQQLQAHQEDLSSESRRADEDTAVLKGQHNAKRDEEASRFASLLAKRRQEGKDKTNKLWSQIEEARKKVSFTQEIKQLRRRLFDSILSERSQSVKADGLQQVAKEQSSIRQTLDVQLARDQEAFEGKLSDVAAQRRSVVASFEKQLAEQQSLHRLQLDEEKELARLDAARAVEKQQALEQQITAAQRNNETLQAALDEEARSHKSQHRAAMSESPALVEGKRQLRLTQQRLQQELDGRRAEMQARVQKVREDCDLLVREARVSAFQEAALNSRAEVGRHRLELSRAQEDANIWQKRCDLHTKHLEQVSFADSFKASCDVDLQPLQHVSNRVIFRLYRALVQEKQAKLSDEEFEDAFGQLQRDAAGHVRLSREEFQDVVRRCDDLQQTFHVRQAFRNIDTHQHGEIEEHEFMLQPLGLDRDTLSHIFFIIEGTGRAHRMRRMGGFAASEQRAQHAITEDSFVNLFSRVQLPYSENLLIDAEEAGQEEEPRVLLVDTEASQQQPLLETEASEQRHASVLATLRMLAEPSSPSNASPLRRSNSNDVSKLGTPLELLTPSLSVAAPVDSEAADSSAAMRKMSGQISSILPPRQGSSILGSLGSRRSSQESPALSSKLLAHHNQPSSRLVEEPAQASSLLGTHQNYSSSKWEEASHVSSLVNTQQNPPSSSVSSSSGVPGSLARSALDLRREEVHRSLEKLHADLTEQLKAPAEPSPPSVHSQDSGFSPTKLSMEVAASSSSPLLAFSASSPPAKRSTSVSTADAQEGPMSPRLALLLNRRGSTRERKY